MRMLKGVEQMSGVLLHSMETTLSGTCGAVVGVPRLARVVIGRPGPISLGWIHSQLPRLRRGSADTRGMQTRTSFMIRDLLRQVPHPASKAPCGEQSSVQKDNVYP